MQQASGNQESGGQTNGETGGVGSSTDGASGESKDNTTASKPTQEYHYASNKNKTYTPQFEEITNKYGLELDNEWNKDLFPHQGRHPNAYHDYILNSIRQFDEIAQGNREIFLELFENLKK